MTSPRTEPIQRLAAAFLAAALLLFIFLTAFQKQHWDTDIFWALKSGEWIISHMEVPRTDPFSYTFAGKEWVDFTWGFQVIVYMFFKAGGWAGLAVMQMILVLSTFFLLYRCLMIVTGRNLFLTLFLTYLVFITCFTRLYARPHLFEYFFITVYIYILAAYESKGTGRRIRLLLPLQVLWVNIHSSFILGIFIAGAWAAGQFIAELREKGVKGGISPGLRNQIIVSALLPVFSLANPYGLKLVIFPFVHQSAGNSDALRHILEWSRLPLSSLLMNFFIFPVDFFSFNVLVALSVVSIALNLKRLNIRDIVLLGGFFYLSVSHARWLSIFAFATAPLIAFNLRSCLKGIGDGRTLLGWALIASSALLMSLTAYVFYIDYSSGKMEPGTGLKRGIFPEVTTAYVKNEGLKGNIYNEYAYGGYLLYNDIKVFIDGRTPTVFSPHLFWQWRMAEKGAEKAWRNLEREYGLRAALVRSGKPLCARLWKDEKWAPAIFDDVSVLYVKTDGGANGPLKLEKIYPCDDKPKYEFPSDPDELAAMRAEMQSVVDYMSRNRLDRLASRPYRLLGLIDTNLGGDHLEKAVDEFSKALSIIDSSETRYDLGLALSRMGKKAEAVEAFKTSVSLDPGYKDAYLALGLAYSDLKDCEESVRYLEKYIELADDGAEHDSYSIMGKCYFDQRRYPLAAYYLKRAAFTADGTKISADIYYKAGSSLFEIGEYVEGARYFATAVEADPAYMEVLRRLAQNLAASGHEEAAGHISSLPGMTFSAEK